MQWKEKKVKGRTGLLKLGRKIYYRSDVRCYDIQLKYILFLESEVFLLTEEQVWHTASGIWWGLFFQELIILSNHFTHEGYNVAIFCILNFKYI